MFFDSNKLIILNNKVKEFECELLNEWVNKNNNIFAISNKELGYNRKTTRNSNNIYYDLPDIIYDIFDRIKVELNLDNFGYHRNGKDGIVCTISDRGSYLKEHVDPTMEEHESYHLLIKTSKNEPGGNLIFNGIEYEIRQGDCLCFFSSINKHSLTEYMGNDLRITWFCSIQIPKELINYENITTM
ncbi:MAG: hypothetical protein FJ187_08245 [Gammaproteobacteria bacterium]|nr:hypothetical protein [Gammaproteobacteria bacterium]